MNKAPRRHDINAARRLGAAKAPRPRYATYSMHMERAYSHGLRAALLAEGLAVFDAKGEAAMLTWLRYTVEGM